MIYLLLSIITSTFIFNVFKLISKNKVNTFHAIVFNYAVCVIVGSLVQINFPSLTEIMHSDWLVPAAILGSMFISVFYVTALTVRYCSMAIASIANKLSLIIPAVVAFVLYDDPVTISKIAGIIIALVAVVLTSYQKNMGGQNSGIRNIIFPLLVLVGSGFIDAASKYCQVHFVDPTELNFFLITVFGTSALIGLVAILIQRIKFKTVVARKSILYGILLGVPNYGSMYFLIAALAHPLWQNSSTFFPINNISIVIATTLCGWLIFKEKLYGINFFGILLAILSICLITFGF